MKRKYLVDAKSILKASKRKALREALLPLAGADETSGLILCANGRNATLKTNFITQERYRQMKLNNAEE